MNKTLSYRDGAVLGIDSCQALHEKLKFEGARLQDKWHPYDAFNFVVTAWHLYADWLPSDQANRTRRMASKTKKENLPMEMVRLLDVLRDLANGSKHLKLMPKSADKRVINETHTGEIDNWLAYFMHERMIGVTAEDDYYFSIRKLRDLLLIYFEWVFDDAVIGFPGRLHWDIWYCAMANRDSKAMPPAGAIPGPRGDPDFVS